MLLGLEASQRDSQSPSPPLPRLFMSLLWPCALLLGKGLTIWVLRVTELPPFLLGEGFVRAHLCLCE